MEIYFIRHGEDLGGKKNRLANLGLTEKGKKQIEKLKNKFSHLEELF